MDSIIVIVFISVLGPIIGSGIGILRMPSSAYVCNMMCFAAGVMLTISFLKLIPESIEISSVGLCVAGVIAGSSIMYGVDRLVPHIHPSLCEPEGGRNLERTAVFLILGIFLHNFPEGMAIAVGDAIDESGVSVAIALAIAIHNIPEGICTSAPFYRATGRRLQAFLLSSATALPILLGYILARFMFQNIPDGVIGFIVGGTAGLMIYITTDEIIPSSCAGTNHRTIFALMAGVIFVILLELI